MADYRNYAEEERRENQIAAGIRKLAGLIESERFCKNCGCHIRDGYQIAHVRKCYEDYQILHVGREALE